MRLAVRRVIGALSPLVAGALVGCGAPTYATTTSSPAPRAPAPIGPVATSLEHHVGGAEHVTFPSRDADLTGGPPTALDGWLFRPPGPGPFAAVIALHGCGGLYAKTGDLTPRHRDWAERLAQQGYVVLLPDSFGARGATELCTASERSRSIRPAYERAGDAYGALLYLDSLPYVRPDRIGLLGWSHGAMSVLGAVSRETASRPASLGHDFRVAVAFYPGCRKTLERTDWMPPVTPVHVLIGANDDWTPAAPCEELTARATAVGATMDIVVYPGAYHDFDDPEMTIHVRHGVASTASHTATIGQDPAARADAIARVTKLLHEALAP